MFKKIFIFNNFLPEKEKSFSTVKILCYNIYVRKREEEVPLRWMASTT
jgi:hypothetical protein